MSFLLFVLIAIRAPPSIIKFPERSSLAQHRGNGHHRTHREVEDCVLGVLDREVFGGPGHDP